MNDDATSSPSDDTRRRAPRPPARVGSYVIAGEIGRGGMGVVYRAFDERLQREVALKALPGDVVAGPAERARLEAEARALARVHHPHVASIFGLEESGGTVYLVLELVSGQSLRSRLEDGALSPSEALALCSQVAAGLDAVHRKGLVHRDLKPGNIMVTPEGDAKLLDFGLARRSATDAGESAPQPDDLAGTPGYMSPEHLSGKPLDAAADAWAWGCVLFECLTGRPAFPGRTALEIVGATLHREPDWSLLPEATPAPVRELLQACLSKDRALRPRDMGVARRILEDARMTSGARESTRLLPRHSLPAERDAFIGRERELEDLRRLVGSGQRLVSVLGPGGSGKTRLVVHLAASALPEFPGGAWFCDLSEARSLDGLLHAVATGLDVPLGPGAGVAQLGHAIAGRGRCLVVLDNFEQVARHAEETLEPWLDRCGEATFVVTTREVLGLPGEQALLLAPMSAADAEALFVARVRQARGGAAPDPAELDDVPRLVALLDRLPLAIELAAARARVMPVKQLLVRMTERFKLLAGAGARRDRQATLRATLDWSWDLLAPWEKAALAQLSVFEGGLTLEAAEAVLDLGAWPEAPWAVDVVQALVDKSLLRRTGDERLEPLASVHEYAGEKLLAPDAAAGTGAAEAAAAQERHGRWLAALGDPRGLAALDAPGGAARRVTLAAEMENLVAACRRAVARGDGGVAAATLAAAWEVLKLRGPLSTAVELARAVAAITGLQPGARARALLVLAEACRHAGLTDEAVARGDEALATARSLGDRELELAARATLGELAALRGRAAEAGEAFAAARELAREIGNRRAEAGAVAALGLVHFGQGRMDDARACLDAARAGAREAGDRRTEGQATCGLGHVHVAQGRLEAARAAYEESLAIAREIGDRRGEGLLLANLVQVLVEEDRLDDAWRAYEEALALARSVGDRLDEGRIVANMGSLRGMQRRFDEARALCEEALRIFRDAGDRRFIGFACRTIGMVHALSGRLEEARAALADGEAVLREIGDGPELAWLLCQRAQLEILAGRRDAAGPALDEADALVARLGADAGPLGREVAATREQLAGGAG